MRQKDMPEWVLKYKTKGHTIKHTANGYALYTATSVYNPGGKPKSVQHFVGMITEDKGLIPKKEKAAVTEGRRPVEYGLSHFIMLNFSRILSRSVFNKNPHSTGTNPFVILGIVKFIFGNISPFSITSCYLSKDREDELVSIAEKSSVQRTNTVCNKIDELLKEHIKDDEERSTIINGLKLYVIDHGASPPNHPMFDSSITDTIEKNRLKI